MNRKAFTLLELLIVILIIAIIATLAFPEYMKWREKAIAAEAINILGAKRRDYLADKLAGVTINIYSFPDDTKYWTFSGVDESGCPPGLSVGAAAMRKDGPYAGTEIALYWSGPVAYKWSGDHPGLPEN